MGVLYSTNQYFSTTLNVGGGLDASQTTGIVLQSVSGITDITKPGVCCVTYADPIVTSTAEWITFTSINGSNELVGVTRGAEGFSAKTHANGATIAFPLSRSHINNLNDKLTGVDTVAIEDVHGNEVLKSTHVNSAVNELTVSNNATGSGPIISATGGDTNIDINLVPKGTGGVKAGKRFLTATSYTTDTGTSLNCDNLDMFIVTAQAGALKFNNPTGTPRDSQTLWIAVTGTAARALTYDTQFEASGNVALPSTTVTTARLDMQFVWVASTSKWRILGIS